MELVPYFCYKNFSVGNTGQVFLNIVSTKKLFWGWDVYSYAAAVLA